MGIVNVTPDSFSDGGEFLQADAAIAHARELLAEGADILDVGGESTRPGAEPVSTEDELRRVLPVLEGITTCGVPAGDAGGSFAAKPLVSIDTSKAVVARAALAAGASIVNDVTALRGDPEMVGLIADSGAQCCLMHMLGEPRTMQGVGRGGGVGGPKYKDVVAEVKAFLEERLSFAVSEGVREERIMLDPGIGFGKTVAHNVELLERLRELTTLGRPLLVGTSRKSFLGSIIADARAEDQPVAPERRLPGTIATNVLALERGASVFRVHDVAPVRDALAVAAATFGGRWTPRVGTTQTS
ncbi:MAG TPA: dihydropteroate synthase [Solirubrobacteraceae bacterium]|jgi:dihydropteroate synthase|nr:dihydropteroate synthase [Solirubrobacteraceae bacterium]